MRIRVKRKKQDNPLLQAALNYAQKGWHIIPLHSIKIDGNCSCGKSTCSKGKHPRLLQWQESASNDPKAIRKWWSKWPDANVGILTGVKSGIIILDVDKEKGGFKSLEKLEQEHGPLDTLRIRTGGGGLHLYFKHPGGKIPNSASKLAAGIDVRGDGGYVVAPPSSHQSGNSYRWESDKDRKLPNIPAWLLKKITQKETKNAPSHAGTHIPEGERNVKLFKIGCKARNQGLGDGEILAILLAKNKQLCSPPLSEGEVKTIAASVAKYPCGQATNKLKDPHYLAEKLLNHLYTHKDIRTLRYYQGRWFHWNGTHYYNVPDKEMRAKINSQTRSTLNGEASTIPVIRQLVDNILQALEGLCLVESTKKMPSWIGESPCPAKGDLLAMKNGLLDVEAAISGDNNPLLKPTPHWFSTTYLPYEYNPEAGCPMWRKFLKEVLPGIEERLLLQEFTGYCLVFDTSFHKALILVGEGANGKSVYTEVATQVLGSENVSHVGLERFDNRFAMSMTIGRLANIVSEIPNIKGVAEDVLKATISGDLICVEFKFHDPIDARPTVRLIFATNEVPEFLDKSEGLWRRLLIIPFEVSIPEERQDRELARKICKRELPGVLNWALRGLRRLREQNCITEPESSKAFRDEHRTASNPARQYLKDNYEPLAGNQLSCDILYSNYRLWCSQINEKPLTKQQFGREVHRCFPEVKRKQLRLGNDNRRQYVYIGLRHVVSYKRTR